MKIVFATNNLHKLKEIKSGIGEKFSISGLNEQGITEDIPETQDTLKGNALEKAHYIYTKYGFDCFADDTGLEVEALGNRPGVYSARYAGPSCSFEDNVNKLLREMKGIENRKACFRTVIAFISNGNEYTFEGRVNGLITSDKKGSKGFGYDPVFQPEGFQITFAEMSLDEKNQVSHRAKALRKFISFLEGYESI